ncbi:MAG: sulfatase-like hydrolase/transferase [Verrucomicrobiales bacterium]|nr:sulfatase-like hydrolase/transferase [Verrucomicrobiales bacterium]
MMKAALAAIAFLVQLGAVWGEKPNIVVFLVDDMGWGDLACYGNKIIKSPHLDKFATEGVRFTQCYSACGVCSPSRSSILTGRTPYRNGVWRWIPGGHSTHLRESEITLPELLKENGYATCHVGKWHLNGHFNSDQQPQPNDHGYDHWMATQNNASPDHKNPTNFVRNGKPMGKLEGFSAPLVATEGVRWLREDHDKEKPFLLSVWTHEPHLPIESAEEFMKPYAHIDDEGIRQHHGNITQLDHAFGIVMQGLDDLGLRDNTMVFFTSDNGPEGKIERGRTQGSTGGLRGRKRDSHEGGIRVAGMVRWPGQVVPGTVSKVPVIGSDIFTTVLGIVGIEIPKDRTIDGADIRPAFKGQPVERQVPLFWRTHIAPEKSRAAMRIGDWKIVADESLTEFQLYEIEKDWQETIDLATEMPKKLAEMEKTFMEVWRGIEAEGPRDWWENEPPREKKGGNPKKLGKGTDESGDWPIVRGGKVTKSPLGYRLSSGGEAIALRKLDKPILGNERVAFKIDYQTAVRTNTRNAMFCFGDKPNNADLVKVGTAIGKGTHEIFKGGWANAGRGAVQTATFDADQKFDTQVVVDLAKRMVTLEIGKVRLEQELPQRLNEVKWVGIYAKGTTSDFSPIEILGN